MEMRLEEKETQWMDKTQLVLIPINQEAPIATTFNQLTPTSKEMILHPKMAQIQTLKIQIMAESGEEEF